MGFYVWTLKNGSFAAEIAFRAPPFAVFLRVFFASHGLNLRFDCKFTWNSMGVDGFEVREFAI